MNVVTSQPVKQFEQYARLGQRNVKLEERICLLLAKLVQIKDKANVERVIADELIWLRKKYAPESIPNRVSKYRKAIQKYFEDNAIPSGLSYPQKTKHGIKDLHIAMSYLWASAEESQAVVDRNKDKTDADQDDPQPFCLQDALEVTESMLDSDDWRDVAAALIFACQCRPVDLLKGATAQAVSHYKIAFTTSLKRKGNEITKEIFVLTESTRFMDRFNWLRRQPEMMEAKKLSNSEVDSNWNSTINNRVNAIYSPIIPPPISEKQLSAHNLRAAGATAGYHLYGKQGQSKQRFVELQLIHTDKGASANYDDYYCVDQDGTEMTAKELRKDSEIKHQPASDTRSNLTADKRTLDIVRDSGEWGEGSNNERLERIIELARKAAQYENELKLTQQKLTVAKAQIEKLEQAAAAAKAEAEATPDSLSTADDVANMPNAELIGSRKRGADIVKLERTKAAIQAYNAGLPLDEQIAINSGSLRAISKVKPTTVKVWMDEHKAELEEYNSGFNYRQNVGKDLSVVKWDESAYGAYDWPKDYFG